MDIFDASIILSDNENATSSRSWFKHIAAQYSVDEDTLMPELCLLAMTELFQRVLLLIKKARPIIRISGLPSIYPQGSVLQNSTPHLKMANVKTRKDIT